jgi:hypothetical protein
MKRQHLWRIIREPYRLTRPIRANDTSDTSPMATAVGCILGLLLMVGIVIFLLGTWAAIAVTWSELHSGAPFHGQEVVKLWLFFLSIPVGGAALIWISVRLLLR